MGLFDKKYCAFCGEKIGMFGNRKLEDGNMCGDCAAKLSPWFNERRHSTVDEIKAQLEYREANQDKVAAFHTTKTIGKRDMFYVDEEKSQFTIATAQEFKNGNPDIVDFADVTGCEIDLEENRDEVTREDNDGNIVSYNPPRYSFEYTISVIFHVNNPYFDQMRMTINDEAVCLYPNGTISANVNPETNAEYKRYMEMAEEIKQTFSNIKEETKDASAPKQAVVCPACGATTIPDANGCCEYCGSSVNG